MDYTEDQQIILDAIYQLKNSIDISPDIRGGEPVLKGTRYPLSRVFAEIIEGKSIKEISENYDLDIKNIKNVISGLALLLQTHFNDNDLKGLRKNIEEFLIKF